MKDSLNVHNIENILLIQLGDIGDVVLSIPSIRALRENFPGARLMVAVREKAKELIEDCRWVTDVIPINQNKRGFIQEISYQIDFFSRLRNHTIDLAIDLRTGDRGAILAFLAGASQRVGFYAHDGKLWRNRVFTHLQRMDYPLGQYVAEYYSSLMAAYHIRTDNVLPELEISEKRLKDVQQLFRDEHIPTDRAVVAIQPFSLWQYKEWGITNYIQLIDRIISEYQLPVIITGSPDERVRAQSISTRFGKNVFNLAGKTTIGMFAAVLKVCKLFIGVDSAGIHIAAAVGTPTVSIFGPSSPASWAPRGPQHAVACKPFPCVPCRMKGCEGKEKSRCLDELSVDEVMFVVNIQMEKILAYNNDIRSVG
jgi:lipopolysaccharide heptosyltransferase II